jgi:tetratricopeptide (TPR) repeat protein
MEHISGRVEAWMEKIVIPTYEVGEPDKNPMFLEKRIYQGSSGRVYPYPVIDKIYDQKKDKAYTGVFLENDFLRILVLPELGGRIQRAYDKTNGYDFIYYNEVIKPALVGLTGPWISGGIEFNWPQHHRPSTFSPVDYAIRENDDGSKTVLTSEVDRMYGTKGTTAFTLYPDKAYIEIGGRLYNPTPFPQTFLWWANPAVAANDNTQSFFPPDVHVVMDHGKRDVSRFPIATGVYYKQDYGKGVDISRYKNISVPTSYMAYHSDYDFAGAYDHGMEAGILHVADHHISPGKKQWTWGNGDFGRAWDLNLTDKNGPYIELMAGVFTDNQPDFSWLKTFEEKTFTQYFMPYKKVGRVKNANKELALGLEVENGFVHINVYATAVYEDACIQLTGEDKIFIQEKVKLSPWDVFTTTVPAGDIPEHKFSFSVYDQTGRLILSYTPIEKKIEQVPEAAKPALPPKQIITNEELYLTALHLEQYRHAIFEPEDYYLEALRRDEGDIRINTAYGFLLLRRGCFAESEICFRRAIKRLIWKNPNPYDSEAYCGLGLSLFLQRRYDEAFDSFYKASWTDAQQSMAFHYLAVIAARRYAFLESLDFIDRALVKNSHDIKGRGLKAVLLRVLGTSSLEWLRSNLELDPFDFLSRLEYSRIRPETLEKTLSLMRNNPESFINVAIDYAAGGFYTTAIETLRLCEETSPLLKYYEARYTFLAGDEAAAKIAFGEAVSRNVTRCFPNRIEDIDVLEFASIKNPGDDHAPYLLGNLFYDKKQYDRAINLWERAIQIDPQNPTAHRNLALGYFNKRRDYDRARIEAETAFNLDKTDARVFMELDQLYKKLRMSPAERIINYDENRGLFQERDDLYIEYVTLLNLLFRHGEALNLIKARQFHPWEGGEGKITSQYAKAKTELAKQKLREGDVRKAVELLKSALIFPHNLGEGKLSGSRDNDIYYWIGRAYETTGDRTRAREAYERAAMGEEEPAGMMFYNDQPADLILYQGLARRSLGQEDRARSRFHKLIDYGETRLFDTPQIDFFAVSLPDLQLFEDDLGLRNQAHCYYLIALGSLGLGAREQAEEFFKKALEIDPSHLGAVLHQRSMAPGGSMF